MAIDGSLRRLSVLAALPLFFAASCVSEEGVSLTLPDTCVGGSEAVQFLEQASQSKVFWEEALASQKKRGPFQEQQVSYFLRKWSPSEQYVILSHECLVGERDIRIVHLFVQAPHKRDFRISFGLGGVKMEVTSFTVQSQTVVIAGN